jgi:hypothetical protein
MARAATAQIGEQHWGVQTNFRARRFQLFLSMVDEIIARSGSCRIIDIGGSVDYWLDLESLWSGRKLSFTLVNLEPQRSGDTRFDCVQGDCRDLSQFADQSFDIVHSNSVIEHVGRWQDMKAMAREVARLAPRYFVQTPNYWFPLEPHFRFPFFHWLPEPVRIAIVLRRSCGAFPKAPTIDDAQRFIEDSILLDTKRFMSLFPGARLQRERLFGLTKSIIAVR